MWLLTSREVNKNEPIVPTVTDQLLYELIVAGQKMSNL